MEYAGLRIEIDTVPLPIRTSLRYITRVSGDRNNSAVGDGFALAFETSTALGSVALGRGNLVLAARTFSTPRAHAVEFLPTVAALCQEHDIKANAIRAVFVSSGPGSFTGLRIGITAARMAAFAQGAMIVPVPTLEVLAQNALELQPPPPLVIAILDAKRRRVYAQTFRHGGDHYEPSDEPGERELERYLAACPNDAAILGDGVAVHRGDIETASFRIHPESFHRPKAETVYRLGRKRLMEGCHVNPRELVPTYIRPPEVEEVWARRLNLNR